ncbi:MAG TPA: 50S ribosomal protein L24 [Fimbriimonadaceae bacterium]|nr:50S ribosomal protein L24 [Fimbriimonadaceae bacterium]
MPTKAELKRLANLPKCKFRKGDKVVIIAGKDKGQEGYIAAVEPKTNRALVLQDNPENPDQPLPLNTVVKHRKARFQNEKSARLKIPAPIDMSNLMVLDPETNAPTRVGRRKEDGKVVRYAKKTGKTIIDGPVIEEKE